MAEKFNSQISVDVSCETLRVIYSILDKEDRPYCAYVHVRKEENKSDRSVTIYADEKDIPHFKDVLNKHQL